MSPLQYGVLGLLALSSASAVGVVFDDALPTATKDDGYYYAAGHVSVQFFPGARIASGSPRGRRGAFARNSSA